MTTRHAMQPLGGRVAHVAAGGKCLHQRRAVVWSALFVIAGSLSVFAAVR